MEPIPLAVGKDEAVALIAERLGLCAPDTPRPDTESVLAAFGQVAALSNAEIAFCDSAELPGLAARTYLPEQQHQAPPPDHRNGVPAGFQGVTGGEHSPALKVLAVPGGTLALVGRAPVVLPATRDRVIADFSSGYAPLVHAYDWSVARVLADAKHIPGDALVLCDDVWPLNFSHWLLDELPRLAFLGLRRDLSLVVAAPIARFQFETLKQFGFSAEQIVLIDDFSAVWADRLLVPCDLREMPHPAFKGAQWALDALRSRFGPADASRPERRKLYVSRGDARGRYLVGEDHAMELLAALGYERLTLGLRSVAEQAALFAGASHVVGLHGAGMANLVFARPGTQVIELFPDGYGTPAFYVVAAACGCRYATYVANGAVVRQRRDQVYDARLDLDHFAQACGDIL